MESKSDTNESTYNTETDSDRKETMVTKGEREGGRDKLSDSNQSIQNI